jgi:hypothetical protein
VCFRKKEKERKDLSERCQREHAALRPTALIASPFEKFPWNPCGLWLGPRHLGLSGGRSGLRLAANPNLQMAPSPAAAEHKPTVASIVFLCLDP